MDIYDLFDGIAEAFRQYQAEMEEQVSSNPNPTGFGAEKEAEKTENKQATEKRVEQDLRSASQ